MSDDEESANDISFDVQEYGADAEAELSENLLPKCIGAVKAFSIARLKQSFQDVCGKEVDLSTWDTIVVKRISGVTQGLLEFDYVNAEGKKFRNRAEVSAHLKLTPAIRKNSRAMTREQLFLSAVEYRERMLLSQQLGLHGFACESIAYSNDEITVHPAAAERGFFAIGNTTVLNWGQIVPFNGFHTSTQLFPLGFRCVRIEHDSFMDTVVDCLCEVDGICLFKSGESVLYSCLSDEQLDLFGQTISSVEALFRISVQWYLPNGAKVVKVYETTRSPQHAWQAAALETLGMKDSDVSPTLILNKSNGTEELNSRRRSVNQAVHEGRSFATLSPCDEEELALRAKVRDSRRIYFRSLRSEQMKGTKVALKMRLSPDNLDGFVDDGIVRLLEGMHGVLACEHYVFHEAREREAGVKMLWKEYGLLVKKAKQLDQILRQHALQTEQKNLFSARKKKADDDAQDEMDSKEMRALVQSALKARNNKARDIEKSVTALKTAFIKSLRKRKDEAKAAVERNMQQLDPSYSPGAEVAIALNESPRPEPGQGSIYMPNALFSQMLEVWVYINSFALNMPDLPALSFEEFQYAIVSSNPVLSELRKRFGRASPQLQSTQFNILERVAMEITKQLIFDFERGMGIDGAEAHLGNLHIPVNELTWREVARLAILLRLSKDLSLTENEIGALIKGRGYSTSPDSLDKKALKLARRRIVFGYGIRNEVQEMAYGYRSGLVVRVPAPSALKTNPRGYWRLLAATINTLPEKDTWVTTFLLQYAQVLLHLIALPLRPTAESLLEKAVCECAFMLRSELVDQFALRRIACVALNECAALCGGSESGPAPPTVTVTSEGLVHEIRRHLALCHNPDLMKENMSVDVDVEDDDIAPVELPGTEDVQDVDGNANNASASNGAGGVEDDSLMVEQLPLSMQRCYLVVRSLMEHPEGVILCDVIPSSAAGFRRRARYAISLKDIRKHLVSGGYGFGITRFYFDVNQVIETAYICCLDNVVNRSVVIRLASVFERLFFEMVLCYDHSLPYNDCCVQCKSQESVSAGRAAVCERCEGVYHIECLEPPLAAPPRSEWTCQACVEQRSVAQAHPYRTASIRHPENANRTGEVVGIEQLRRELVFVVDFKSSREALNRDQIRALAVTDPSDEGVYRLPDGYSLDEFDQVCGLVRAYCGYCSPALSTPSVLVDSFCKSAASMLERDVDFSVARDAVSLLSSCDAMSDDLHADDWLVILRALMNAVLRSSFHAALMPNAEEQDAIVLDLLDKLGSGANLDQKLEDAVDVGDVDSAADDMSVGRMVPTAQRKLVKAREISPRPPTPGDAVMHASDDESSLCSLSIGGDVDDDDAEDDFAALYEDSDDEDEEANPALQWMWQVKGREDALQCHTIIMEAMTTLDLDYKVGVELEESQPLVRKQLGDFWPHAMAAVVKSCVCKAPESEIERWSVGWESKMRSLLDPLDSKPLCELCGTDEAHLCSPFVRLPADLSSVAVVDKVTLWPLVDGDADDVPSSSVRDKLVHSCCADTYFVLKIKKSKLLHSSEDLGVVERLCTAGWSSIVVLGSDRDQCNFWVFPGSNAIFAQRLVGDKHIWSIYSSEKDKASLMSWLSAGHPREALLKRTLRHLNVKEATAPNKGDDRRSRSPIKKTLAARFEVGDTVCLANYSPQPLYWTAEVVEAQFVEGRWMYGVRLLDWSEGERDRVAMVPEDQLLSEDEVLRREAAQGQPAPSSLDGAVLSAQKSFLARHAFTAPPVLLTLQARAFLQATDRACGQRPPMGFSSCSSVLEQLRAAMLIVEAALPTGAVDDESEDRWADDFVVAWREAVSAAADPVALMQCQLMLEYGIRTSWLKPTGLKMFSCLPSRFNCLRHATFGMVAVRIWVLDMTIKYDKTQSEIHQGKKHAADQPAPGSSKKKKR